MDVLAFFIMGSLYTLQCLEYQSTNSESNADNIDLKLEIIYLELRHILYMTSHTNPHPGSDRVAHTPIYMPLISVW